LLQGLDLFPVLAWKKREQPSAAWAARYGKDFDRVMYFLAASQRRQTLKSIGKLCVFAVICIIAALMTVLWRQADTERNKAASARLLAQAHLERGKSPPQYPLSVLLAIEAFNRSHHSELILNQFLLGSLDFLQKPLHVLQHDANIDSVVYSPDGKCIATVSGGKTVRLWNVETGEELKYKNYADVITAVTFSHDGQRLATASQDKIVHLWDISDISTVKELPPLNHDGIVNIITFSPDGQWLATASRDKIVHLWDISDISRVKKLHQLKQDRLHLLNHDRYYVNGIVFSSDGQRLATSEGNTVRIWNAATGKELQRLKHSGHVTDVTFSPDGEWLATASQDKTARLWDATTGQELKLFVHDDSVKTVSFSPDNRHLVAASEDNTARLWDTKLWKLQSFHIVGKVNTLSISPYGQQLVTTSQENPKIAQIWDIIATGNELLRLKHNADVSIMTFSPDGKKLATANRWKYTVQLWDAATGKELPPRLNHDGGVSAVIFSSDGKQVATASRDKTTRLWDAATGKELHRLSHDGEVTAVTYSPDGKQVATASRDKTARLWDAGTGKELQRLSHDNIVNTVTFSPDGKRLATTTYNNVLRLWDAGSGKKLRILNNDDLSVAYVFFSPNNKWIATASGSKTIQFWDAATGQQLQLINHDSNVTTQAFSPDGKRLATASGDRTVRVWLWQPEDLINELCTRLINNLTWDQWQRYIEGEPYRKTCPNLPVYLGYQEQVRRLVNEGKNDEATRMLAELNAADSTLQLNPEKEILKWTEGPKRLEKAKQLLKDDKIAEATAALNEVEKMEVAVPVKLWNTLCWKGALMNSAPQVLDACNKAVEAAKGDELWHFRDSRGLAQAMTGNTQGAIDDFKFYIKNTTDEIYKKQREDWVKALEVGQNPFTKEELATLQNQ
jgi:WD40 repeat protein